MRIHFIAMGGSVMHQLAIALHRKGYQVTGSDDEIFEPALGNLKREGILPAQMGWNPNSIDNQIDAVILGMHARSDNPELLRAKELGLPIYSFPEYIYRESRDKTRIVVGGSHGKTTTTSMIMHVLKEAGRSFDWLVGAKLDGFDQSVQITDAPVIVCEGDEYPASAIEKRPKFHFLHPQVAILTGIAWDHINVFPTFEFYLEQFRIFIAQIEPGGCLIYNETDPVLVKLVDEFRGKVKLQPYGLPKHWIAEGKTLIELDGVSGPLQVFGDHNLLNLHAAYLACCTLGIDATVFVRAIGHFRGASKRLELLASNKETLVYRDFAHAPSKVKATIQAVRQQFPGKKLIAVLELHTYSSLNKDFLDQYKDSLQEADEALVFYSSHALEMKKLPPLSAEAIATGFGRPDLVVEDQRQRLEEWLLGRDYHQSVLLLMSSGNYDGMDIITFAKKLAG